MTGPWRGPDVRFGDNAVVVGRGGDTESLAIAMQNIKPRFTPHLDSATNNGALATFTQSSRSVTFNSGYLTLLPYPDASTPGMWISPNGTDQWQEIESIDNNTQLTLRHPFPEATLADTQDWIIAKCTPASIIVISGGVHSDKGSIPADAEGAWTICGIGDASIYTRDAACITNMTDTNTFLRYGRVTVRNLKIYQGYIGGTEYTAGIMLRQAGVDSIAVLEGHIDNCDIVGPANYYGISHKYNGASLRVTNCRVQSSRSAIDAINGTRLHITGNELDVVGDISPRAIDLTIDMSTTRVRWSSILISGNRLSARTSNGAGRCIHLEVESDGLLPPEQAKIGIVGNTGDASNGAASGDFIALMANSAVTDWSAIQGNLLIDIGQNEIDSDKLFRLDTANGIVPCTVSNTSGRQITESDIAQSQLVTVRSELPGFGVQTVAVSAAGTYSFRPALGSTVTIDVQTPDAFTIAAPANPINGQLLEITVANNSGGVMGAITWDAVFRLAGAFVNPADTMMRTISFRFDGSAWVEHSRTAADL